MSGTNQSLLSYYSILNLDELSIVLYQTIFYLLCLTSIVFGLLISNYPTLDTHTIKDFS
jgi:hypothetical protein